MDAAYELLAGLWTAATGSTAEIQALSSKTPELHRDAFVIGLFTVVCFLINWGLRLIVVEPVVRIMFNMKKSMVQKFAQSALEVVFYGSFTILGLLVVPQQEFAWPSDLWWKGFSTGEHSFLRADLRCYYLLYVSRYVQGGISTMMEHKRKDFVEMQIHHWTTVIVILLSYAYGWTRVGTMVMVILDPADVFLHAAKMCKYCSDSFTKACAPKRLWQSGADVLFALFAVVFFITRLVMYPYVCWSAKFESSRHFVKDVGAWICLGCLMLLLVLQVYWFSLLLKAIYKLLIKGAIEDVRSDDEDEDEKKKD